MARPSASRPSTSDVQAIADSPDVPVLLELRRLPLLWRQLAIATRRGCRIDGQPEPPNGHQSFTAELSRHPDPPTSCCLEQAGGRRGRDGWPGPAVPGPDGPPGAITTGWPGRPPSRSRRSALTCGTTAPLTGQEVLATMPSSFVDREVEFLATAHRRSARTWPASERAMPTCEHFYAHPRPPVRHRLRLDYAVYTTQSAAADAAAAAAYGTPFAKEAASAAQSGSLRCDTLSDLALPCRPASAPRGLAVGQVSTPIASSGGLDLDLAVQSDAHALRPGALVGRHRRAGCRSHRGTAAARGQRRGAPRSTSNPQYGVWVSGVATVFTPLTPRPADVLNASANEPFSAPRRPPRPTADRGTAPPPRHGGGPRTRRRRPPAGGNGGPARGSRRPRLPAHGASPGRGAVRGRPALRRPLRLGVELRCALHDAW